MISKQNPFSFYDFLGYFIPGAITLYFFFFAYFHAQEHQFGLKPISETMNLFKKDFYLPFIIVSYIVGHFLSFFSSITIEKYSNWCFGYPSKYLLSFEASGFFKPSSAKCRRMIARFLVALFVVPVSFLDFIFGYVMNLRELYVKSASELTIKMIKLSVREVFQKPFSEIVIDDEWFKTVSFFRFCYHYALENAPNHNTKMQNYVALYGFARTFTLIFILFFWVFVWHVCLGRFCLSYAIIFPIISSFIAYTFFIAFNKFYRRYSLEALMATSTAIYNTKYKT